MVALTEAATTVIKRLVAGSKESVDGLRIMVEHGGCSGLQYMLGLESRAEPGDEVYEFDGVRIYVDPSSLPIVHGMQVDFVETLEQSGFVFENPNVGDVCSCGKSFGG